MSRIYQLGVMRHTLDTTSPAPIGTADSYTADRFAYTPCYCEENCYLLVQQLSVLGCDLNNLFVVFISNSAKQV